MTILLVQPFKVHRQHQRQADGWPPAVMLIGWAAEPWVPRGRRLEANPIEEIVLGTEPVAFWNLGHLLRLNVQVRKLLG